ncbi:adenylate and Guanylate cyclase catalytic domain protein [delta proteobacterium NaphS2]|nr:adenylate and Guanylate cyclase catalytic domain protein [delta proteobacterium NaphS2]
MDENDYSSAGIPLALWGDRFVPLLEKIAMGRPKAVGFDIIFPQFTMNQINGEHDQKLFKALRALSNQCRVVSGYGINQQGLLKEPFVFYQKILGPDGYGFLNVTTDEDGICREQILRLSTNDSPRMLFSFSWLLSGAKGEPAFKVMPDWRNPSVFPTLSFEEALKADPDYFKDKIIIIGFDLDFEDRHRTPVSKKGEPGVVFQARIVDAIRNNSIHATPSCPYSLLAPAVLMILFALLLTRRASLLRVIFSGTGLLAGLAIVVFGFLTGGIVLKPSAAIMGIPVVCIARVFQGYLMVKDTFGRYVSREVRDEILSGRVPVDGEIKEVTVLFADLRDFTSLVERTPPKEVVKLINRYFEEMAKVIRDHKGLVLQFIGDEIEAVFGAPVFVEDHRNLAVQAGIEMCRSIEIVNQQIAQRGYAPLRQGIGIHSGEVLAGNIGGGGRMSYALVGDTVNLASRLQGLNRQFGSKIIISGQTLSGIDKEIAVQKLPSTPIKGKIKKVDIFSVL